MHIRLVSRCFSNDLSIHAGKRPQSLWNSFLSYLSKNSGRIGKGNQQLETLKIPKPTNHRAEAKEYNSTFKSIDGMIEQLVQYVQNELGPNVKLDMSDPKRRRELVDAVVEHVRDSKMVNEMRLPMPPASTGRINLQETSEQYTHDENSDQNRSSSTSLLYKINNFDISLPRPSRAPQHGDSSFQTKSSTHLTCTNVARLLQENLKLGGGSSSMTPAYSTTTTSEDSTSNKTKAVGRHSTHAKQQMAESSVSKQAKNSSTHSASFGMSVPLGKNDPYRKEHNDLLDIVKQKMEQERQMQGSQKVVTLAITSNLIMLCGKLYAAYQSGSASMFSEALHSIADILNESLLMLGINRSLRQPDELHPYGYVQERYAWALVSGVGIFFLGGGASLYRGISGLLDPGSEVGDPTSAYVVLGAALMFEMITLRYAYQHIRDTAHEQGISFKDYFFKGADPTAVQVFAEDCASVTGIAIAGTCVTLSKYYDLPMLDSVGSLMIGSLLICVAGFLIRRNISGLVETSMHTTKLNEIVALLEYDPVVKAVHNVKSLSVSPDEARFKADIQFDGMEITRRYIKTKGAMFDKELYELTKMKSDKDRKEWFIKHGGEVVESMGAEVDRLEENIRSKRPEVKHIDLESS